MKSSAAPQSFFMDYRKSINPPYHYTKIPSLVGTIFFILSLPLIILVIAEKNNLRLSAQTPLPGITFLDDSNQQITETMSPTVKVKLLSPWPAGTLSRRSSSNNVMGVVDQVYAQTAGTTQTYRVSLSSDDVNQDGSSFDTTSSTAWIGNGQSTSSSYTGLRFTNVTVPRGATITSAKLQVLSAQSQWINVRLNIGAHASGNSPAFSTTSRPSQRTLTSARVNDNSNLRWNANTWYSLKEIKDVVQEIVNRSDWNSGNSLSIIMKGTGGAYGRKFVSSVDGGSNNAPRLVITYSIGSSSILITPTNTLTPLPSSTPTSTPVPPTATPTPVVKTASAVLAEDASFTKNVVNIASFTTNPLTTNYTFSDPTPGTKTLYVKFISTSGGEQTYSGTISLASVSTPTAPQTATATPTPVQTSGTPIWGAVDPIILGECSAAVHDKYVVDGNDGFLYRTWHAQVDPSGCIFAHEHGDNPDTMTDTWVRANWNPGFGYAARRMTSAAEPNGHVEAHEGFKVFSANVGLVNDEGKINRTASLSTFHMGTGGPKRFTVQHHSNNIAYRYQTGTPYAATSLMLDTGGVSDVCDPRADAPTKDALTLQNRCKVNSPYEIWGTTQSIKDGGREIYRVFVTPAVFDPITVFNRDNPLEVVYAWDPRVAAIKNFNDDWSGHRGCKRENYAQIGYFYNAGGPTTYYTDHMGNVVPQSDPKAIRQIVSASNVVGLASTQDNLQFKMPTSYCQQIGKLGLKN